MELLRSKSAGEGAEQRRFGGSLRGCERGGHDVASVAMLLAFGDWEPSTLSKHLRSRQLEILSIAGGI